ncbi:MAG: glycosyltransferase [Opitutae bacterium]|jgi:glycosyltransferase involved in cell wall biosynthesis|nr:glycosyltransferase [Opitutae bacterium]MBT5690519.1 glycosyltransferase [Opitutae bacterium]MBT6463696.1 glycosyltransferase [Opitutae bacterium]MBT7855217.1 glycosyltransferase [Opitutae bacterium]
MNILYSFRTRGVGAESVHISGIANALESLGNTIDFESPTGVDPRQKIGINPYNNSKKDSRIHTFASKLPGPLFELAELAYNLRARRRINRRLTEKNYGLIYERHAFFLHSTSQIAKKRGIPYVVEVNELVGDERVRQQPFLLGLCKWCDKQIFQNATKVVTVSPHLKRKITQQYRIPDERILVHPNAVESSLLDENPDPEPIKQRFNLRGKLPIGFVGWFVEWHRLDILLEAFATLCKQDLDSSPILLLIGDGPLKPALNMQARKLGIADNISFTGTIPHEEIPAILKALDIAVIPHSNQYRSPIKLFEYMAQACAITAPASEPIKEIIKDGANGLLFHPLATNQLGENLIRLAKSPKLREKLGQAARQSVETNYTWKHNAQDLLNNLSKETP